jgi:hypothetical protein
MHQEQDIFPIDQLPDELLIIVFEELVASLYSYIDVPRTIKSLRLVNKRFAALRWLKSTLLRRVELIADANESSRLMDGSFSRIAPFVEHITFVPTLYSWRMSCDQFIAYVMDSDEPSSEQDVMRSWEPYRLKAQASELMTSNGVLKSRWMGALRQADRCHSFSTVTVDYFSSGSDTRNGWPHPIIWPEEHHHLSEACGWDVGDPMGDEFFELVVGVLADTGVEIHKLDLGHVANGYSAWSSNLGWNRLAVANLKEVFFRSENLTSDPTKTHGNGRLEMVETPGKSAMDILKRCAANVEDFIFASPSDMSRLAPLTADLPCLKILKLWKVWMEGSCLARWISSASKLQSISLGHVILVRVGSGGEWRRVFDTIRDHNNNLAVCLDSTFLENLAPDSRKFHLELRTSDIDLNNYRQRQIEVDTTHGMDGFLESLRSMGSFCWERYKDTDPDIIESCQGSLLVIDMPWSDFEGDIALYLGGLLDWNDTLEKGCRASEGSIAFV